MTLESIILGLVGAIVQFFLKLFPGLSDWYAGQKYKALLAMGFVLLVSLAYFGLGCTPLAKTLGIAVACTVDGAIELGGVFFSILVGQQITYVLFGGKQ